MLCHQAAAAASAIEAESAELQRIIEDSEARAAADASEVDKTQTISRKQSKSHWSSSR